ncbi:hypothetical protein KEM54_003089 [Ascosphaera aggregata]|nr:hypothetical protein KEM54_003089 [Ascosphaera aggregata]
MIIAGGYGIRGKNKSKRHQLVDRSDAHDRVHIFDIDSESWVPNYHAPERPKPGELSNNKGGSGPLSTPGQRAAMALGIIVGVMLIGMGLLFCFLRQRRHSRRQANNGDRQLPASDMSETPRFEPPAVFAEYRERMRATPMSGGMRSYWSASVPLHHTSSSLDSDAYSYGSSDPLEVPDLGAGCGGLGIDSNLSMSLSRSSKDEHDEPSMSKSFLDSPPALVRGERAALGLQASEPLLARDIDAATKPYVDNDWKGKRKAAKDEVEGCQLPAIKGRFGYEWSRRPGKLGQYFYREGRKDGSSCESNERTMSDLSEMSGQSHSTAYTEPLFSSRLGGMVAALTSSSDPPFLQRALSRSKYEVIRQPDRRQHITARSFHSLTSSHYVSLNQPEQNEYGLDIIVTPAPNLAKLKVRGRPKMQPEDCGRSEDIHGIFGNVEQLTGPARKAQHVGEPQSVQPEIASIQGLGISASSLSARSRPETRSTNEFNSTKSKEGEEDNASLEPTAAQAFRLTATNLPMGKRKPSNHSDESFNSLNYPEDCEIEQALEGVVISTPSPVRLVISRSGSKRECRPPAESGT